MRPTLVRARRRDSGGQSQQKSRFRRTLRREVASRPWRRSVGHPSCGASPPVELSRLVFVPRVGRSADVLRRPRFHPHSRSDCRPARASCDQRRLSLLYLDESGVRRTVCKLLFVAD